MENQTTETPAPSQTSAKNAPARSFIAEWAITIVLLLFGSTTLVQAYVIPTGSMEDTVLVGDHLLVDKLTYAPTDAAARHLLPYETIHRGDIIIFRYPFNIKETYIKRVIGVPGDRIHLVNKEVFLNGHPLTEPYAIHKTGYVDAYRDNFPADPDTLVVPPGRRMLSDNVENGEVVVPAGHYFAMGDNRDDSLDSRYWGFVPRANIIGKPLLIYWSYDANTEDLESVPSARYLFNLATHFFTKTRWNREMRLFHSYPIL